VSPLGASPPFIACVVLEQTPDLASSRCQKHPAFTECRQDWQLSLPMDDRCRITCLREGVNLSTVPASRRVLAAGDGLA